MQHISLSSPMLTPSAELYFGAKKKKNEERKPSEDLTFNDSRLNNTAKDTFHTKTNTPQKFQLSHRLHMSAHLVKSNAQGLGHIAGGAITAGGIVGARMATCAAGGLLYGLAGLVIPTNILFIPLAWAGWDGAFAPALPQPELIKNAPEPKSHDFEWIKFKNAPDQKLLTGDYLNKYINPEVKKTDPRTGQLIKIEDKDFAIDEYVDKAQEFFKEHQTYHNRSAWSRTLDRMLLAPLLLQTLFLTLFGAYEARNLIDKNAGQNLKDGWNEGSPLIQLNPGKVYKAMSITALEKLEDRSLLETLNLATKGELPTPELIEHPERVLDTLAFKYYKGLHAPITMDARDVAKTKLVIACLLSLPELKANLVLQNGKHGLELKPEVLKTISDCKNDLFEPILTLQQSLLRANRLEQVRKDAETLLHGKNSAKVKENQQQIISKTQEYMEENNKQIQKNMAGLKPFMPKIEALVEHQQKLVTMQQSLYEQEQERLHLLAQRLEKAEQRQLLQSQEKQAEEQTEALQNELHEIGAELEVHTFVKSSEEEPQGWLQRFNFFKK